METVNAKARILLKTSILLWIAAVSLFICAGVSMFLARFKTYVDAGGEQLVYHTNNAAVLQACRVVLADPQSAGFPKPTNGVSEISDPQTGSVPSAALPAALRNLNFEVINVEGDKITIYFGGGFGHWG
jgi:hypothetical protein